MFEAWCSQQCSYGEAAGWCRTSDDHLRDAEHKLLTSIKSLEDDGIFADIGGVVGNTENKVLTYRANCSSSNTPLVLLHGFGCPSAFWCLNVDSLAQHRPVYFMDILDYTQMMAGHPPTPDAVLAAVLVSNMSELDITNKGAVHRKLFLTR
ncbi:Alpha/Beta hydrolase fold [Trinorchestia longiramus]|nr:Alpha/Beta hydrolase fold [Trinorchestia longiramus]